ncbi:protein of unknown function [Ralstonia sp. 25mfcol4.1]|uniref:DUF4124 domain-containing protein n=1 Tax=Burkholderiaceae TaxID=119060 RepID=UPI00088079C4|nr:DUF4124 domain-containing protein [Ralstonia sp. 25mfcol4.1]SDP40065.1 protein of unknown function [Ralstonia sp. 25mfcol4.1]
MKRSSALYLLIAASLAIPGTALSQWQWKDANGRTVYSDVPPPPSVPERAILAAPGRAAGAYRPLETETAQADGKPAPSGSPRMQPVIAKGKADKPLDADEAFRERRDARIKADLEAATKERAQLARDERCQQLRNYATGLSAGVRVSRSGADGAPVRLNDDERTAELARTNDSINQQCSS